MKKIAIYPSILALKDSPTSWDEKVSALTVPLSGLHYDIGDGIFVPSTMLRPEDVSEIHLELPIDVHLMVQKPSLYFSTLAFQRSAAVAFHLECDENIQTTIQYIKDVGKKVGLALLHTTSADKINQYLSEIDYVLVMTVQGGYAGTPFIPKMMEKVHEIHEKNPQIPILVDGGVGETTLPLCIEAGATRAVMSSALFNTDTYAWLEKYT